MPPGTSGKGFGMLWMRSDRTYPRIPHALGWSIEVLPRNNRTISVFPTSNPGQIPSKFQFLGGKLTPGQTPISWWARKSLWNVQKPQMMDFILFGATMESSKGKKKPWRGWSKSRILAHSSSGAKPSPSIPKSDGKLLVCEENKPGMRFPAVSSSRILF